MPSIFVIDDDKDLLAVVKSLLRKRGFEVSAFFDWNIASKALKLFKPQIILLDVFLHGIDGLDICKKLRTSPFTKFIPILVYSGFPKIEQSAIYDYGADDFIAKPFEFSDLVKKLENILLRFDIRR